MSHRGGARRLPVPIVCQDSLTNVLENHVKEVGVSVAFFFGAYEYLGRSQAVHAAGLKFNEKLLWNLIRLAPSGEIKISQFKAALLIILKKFPQLNKTHLDSELWAGFKGDKMSVMFAHIRRYKVDIVRQRQALSKATNEDRESIDCLADLLQLKEAAAFSPVSSGASVSSATPVKKNRELKREVSLDESGYPRMLLESSDEVPLKPDKQGQGHLPPTKKLKAVDMACASAVDPLLAEAFADLGSSAPASVPTPSAQKPTTKRALAPHMSKSLDTGMGPFVSKAFGKLYITRASKQSYIQIDVSGKKTLLVALSTGAFPLHNQDILKIASWVCSQGPSLTKDGVLRYRAAMVASH